MKRIALAVVVAVACGWSAFAQAAEPTPSEFTWRAPLQVPPQAGLVRLDVPADALARLQSPALADIRVFDSQGQPVPFARAGGPAPAEAARVATPAFTALPLHSARPGARPPQGSVQVSVRGGEPDAPSVWVQIGPTKGTPAATTSGLPAALFDTRAQKDPVTALVLQGRWPANTPIAFEISTSTDLAVWTPVAARGRVYRFEGENAPVNETLELASPLSLEHRYLRLAWHGQDGVTVQAITGLLAARVTPPPQPVATLAAPRQDGPNALEWDLGFTTPIAELALTTDRVNTLVPVRILGRSQASEPWRLLAHTVVHRLAPEGPDSVNAPVVLQRPSVRWLRVEATHGMRLQGITLSARAAFDPVRLVFVASGSGPFELAAGRPTTPPAALPLALLPTAASVRVEALGAAIVGAARVRPAGPPSAWSGWLPGGFDGRAAGLWAVLAAGVLVLGVVAWSLLRQLGAADTKAD